MGTFSNRGTGIVTYYVGQPNIYGSQPTDSSVVGAQEALANGSAPGNAYVDLSGRAYQTNTPSVVTPQNLVGQLDQGAKTSSNPSSLSLSSVLAGGVTSYYTPSLVGETAEEVSGSGSPVGAEDALSTATGALADAPSKNEGKSEESRGKGIESSAQQAGNVNISADDSPGKAAQGGIQGIKQELEGASKEAMGSPEANQLQQMSQSLGQQSQQVAQADKLSKQSKTVDKAAQGMEKAGAMLSKIGSALEKVGTSLSTAGQAMIASGQALLSNPFTAAAGAAMVAAGTALKIAGTAMKVAGKAMQAAGKAMEKIAKVLAKVVKTLLKLVNKILDKLNKVLANISKKIKDILAKLRRKKPNKADGNMGANSASSKTSSKADNKKVDESQKAGESKKVDETGKTDKDKKDQDDEEGGSFLDTAKEVGTDLAIDTALMNGLSMVTSGGDDVAAAGAEGALAAGGREAFGSTATMGNEAVSSLSTNSVTAGTAPQIGIPGAFGNARPGFPPPFQSTGNGFGSPSPYFQPLNQQAS